MDAALECPRCTPRLSTRWAVTAPQFCPACLAAFSDILRAMDRYLQSLWLWPVYAVISGSTPRLPGSRYRWEGLGLLLPPGSSVKAPSEEWLYQVRGSGPLPPAEQDQPLAQLWQQRIYWSTPAFYLEKRWHPEDTLPRPLALVAPETATAEELWTLWQGRRLFEGKKRVTVPPDLRPGP